MRLSALVRQAAAELRAAGVASPEHDAAELAAFLGVSRAELVMAEAPPGFVERYRAVVARRGAREPLQHITGHTGFRNLVLATPPGVFVPRPETEVVAQVAISAAQEVACGGAVPVVVDLCCGGGAIAISAAAEVPTAQVHAVELAPEAVALARTNAAACGVRVAVVEGDATSENVLGELDGAVHVVVANPPYVPPDGVPVDPEVSRHEPALALYGGGPDGLEVPRGVVATAARLLRPGGVLVVEHADLQGGPARAMVREIGAFADVHTRTDLTGRDRMVVARRM